MQIGRLRAYGKKWRDWASAGRFRREPRIIPRAHQDKGLLRQESDGEYEITLPLVQLAKDLEIWKDKETHPVRPRAIARPILVDVRSGLPGTALRPVTPT